MFDSYDNFSKKEINLMKDLIVFLREPKKYENEKLNNFYTQLQWQIIYNKNGLKTKEDIQNFSEKLCNADLAIPWYLNHEENIFGIAGISRYEIDKMKNFVILWEKENKERKFKIIKEIFSFFFLSILKIFM